MTDKECYRKIKELKGLCEQYAATSTNYDSKLQWEQSVESIDYMIGIYDSLLDYIDERDRRYEELMANQAEFDQEDNACLMNLGQRIQIVEDKSLLMRYTGV